MAEEKIEIEQEGKKQLHKRYEWLDQFRGMIIIFLIISVITWPLSGNFPGTEIPIGIYEQDEKERCRSRMETWYHPCGSSIWASILR